MARYHIVQWRDIPALVVAVDDNGTVRQPLSPRFQALIDTVAMREGATETETYLEGWEESGETERLGAALDVAEAVAAELEAGFEVLLAQQTRP